MWPDCKDPRKCAISKCAIDQVRYYVLQASVSSHAKQPKPKLYPPKDIKPNSLAVSSFTPPEVPSTLRQDQV